MCSLDTMCSKNEGAEIVLNLDGARFTNHTAHVACGVKVVDIRSRDLKRSYLLLNFQIRDHSYVFEMHLMKGTKDGHKYFR